METTHTTSEVKENEFVKQLATTKKSHLIDGKFYYTEDDVFKFFTTIQQKHHQELEKAVEAVERLICKEIATHGLLEKEWTGISFDGGLRRVTTNPHTEKREVLEQVLAAITPTKTDKQPLTNNPNNHRK